MTRKLVLLPALTLVVALSAYFFLRPDRETRQVLKVFATAQTQFAKTGPESPIVAGRKAQLLSQLLADPCTLQVPEAGLKRNFSADTALQQILVGRNYCTSLHLHFDALQISFPSPTHATVMGDVTYTGESSGYKIAGLEAREVLARLQKVDNSWRFTYILLRPIAHK